MTPQELEEEMLSNPVQNLQYMLRRLGTRYSFLPQLATDGLFGEETLEAVMLFQRELAPPVTGVVDGRTWDAIRREWMALEREVAPPRSLRIFPGEGAQMLPGGEEEYMVLPQTMFQLLRQRLEGIVEDEANGQHGDASVQNTLWLQNLAQLEETGVMDRATWDMLSRLYELFITAGSGSGTAAHQNLTLKSGDQLLTWGLIRFLIGREEHDGKRRSIDGKDQIGPHGPCGGEAGLRLSAHPADLQSGGGGAAPPGL